MIKWPVKLYVRKKKHDFYVFLVVAHVFPNSGPRLRRIGLCFRAPSLVTNLCMLKLTALVQTVQEAYIYTRTVPKCLPPLVLARMGRSHGISASPNWVTSMQNAVIPYGRTGP